MRMFLQTVVCVSLVSALWACDDGDSNTSPDQGVVGAGGEGGAGGAGGGQGGQGGAGGQGGEGGVGGQGGEGGVGGQGGEGGAGGQGGEGGGAGGEGGGAGGMGGGAGGMGGEGGAVECIDGTYWADADADGYGEPDGMQIESNTCDVPDNYAPNMDDCADDDPWRNPEASEICGDNLDDDCDGSDGACPETAPLGMNEPDWDCTGDVPANVYAYAHFADGDAYFQAGGCFIYFEGSPGQFFVQRANLERTNQDASCDQINGCTCPSANGWPAYDRRMYAFNLAGTPEECEEISIRDHAGEEQVVSNSCRKYLYQLHFYDIPYSFVTDDVSELDRRLTLFPTVEIACAEDAPHANLPFQTLRSTPVVRNPGFTPMAR